MFRNMASRFITMTNPEIYEQDEGGNWSLTGSPSDVVAQRVKEVRKRRNLTVQQLAKVCADMGASELTATMIYNIESGRPDKDGNRRRQVTVDELMTLATALEVAPVHLLVPPGPGAGDAPEAVAAKAALHVVLRDFIRGTKPLPGMDARAYFSETPPDEFSAMIFRDRDAD